MKFIALLFAFFLAMAPLQAKQWKGKWITSEYSQSKTNSWLCFQKIVDLPASAKVTVDTRYGMIKAYLQRKGNRINIQIEVPEGTSAIVMGKGKPIRLESGKHQVSVSFQK